MRRRGIGRVGGPGLVGTAARTAVIAGTATAVSGNVARRQAGKAQQAQAAQMQAAQAAAPPPPPAPAPAEAAPMDTADMAAKLRELAALRDDGILSDTEFEVQKARILAGS
jgi:hypothetical protein